MPKHGTYPCYVQNKCRQPECMDAMWRYMKRLHRDHSHGIYRLQPALGTHRRLRALMAMGWRRADLADRLGVSPASVKKYLERDQLNIKTIGKVSALYDELCMTAGPSNRTRLRAKKLNHPPPLAWDDLDDPNAIPAGVRDASI